MNNRELSEDAIQAQIYQTYHNTYCLNGTCIIFSVPNGGTRNIKEAMKLKATGLVPGVSDLMVNHKGTWHCVEVKKPGMKQSNAQEQFEETVKGLGTTYNVVTSLGEFQELVKEWDL